MSEVSRNRNTKFFFAFLGLLFGVVVTLSGLRGLHEPRVEIPVEPSEDTSADAQYDRLIEKCRAACKPNAVKSCTMINDWGVWPRIECWGPKL